MRIPITGSNRTTLLTLLMAVAGIGCAEHASLTQTRMTNASLDMDAYRTRAPVIQHPLTLEDALDYAARYNLEVWIVAQESALQYELATQSKLKMLPSLMAGSETHSRSNFDASSSQSLLTRKQSLEPSFSSEKRGGTFDISLTWNLLDFGISFLRARQQDSRASIALERERRVRQNLALEVTATYWQAVTTRESANDARRITEEVTVVLSNIRKQIEDKAVSEIEGLKQETSLLERLDELRRFERNYLKAKTRLGKLIGLPPGTDVDLADVDLDKPIEPLAYDIEKLELQALHNRPELFEKDLEQAISRDEARIALARMFPSPAMFFQFNYDTNRFLAFEKWHNMGVRASWDLLSIPQQIKQRDAINIQTELVAKRRVAVAVAILTQLHLSLIEYEEALEQHHFAKTISEKCGSLLEAVESTAAEGKSHAGESIGHKMKYLKTRAKCLTAYANVMTSKSRLFNTVGQDAQLLVDEAPADTVAGVTDAAMQSSMPVAAPERTEEAN